jgi:hypothetical protein
VVDLDLSVKPRDPEASIRIALRDVQCPRCNGYGRPRIIALARHQSIPESSLWYHTLRKSARSE